MNFPEFISEFEVPLLLLMLVLLAYGLIVGLYHGVVFGCNSRRPRNSWVIILPQEE